MHVSFKIHYRNNLIDKKESYLILCLPSWNDRKYSYSHQLYPSESLLYEDRLLAVDTPETLKECFSLSKSLYEKGIFSWYSYINYVRTKIKMDLGNQDMKKNSCKKYYKNILSKI